MKPLLTLAVGLATTCGVASATWGTPAQATDNPDIAPELDPTEMPVEVPTQAGSPASPQIALSFAPPQSTHSMPAPLAHSDQVAPASPPAEEVRSQVAPSTASREDLFAGGGESIVARTVGAAEGTRTPEGGKTDIYEGHVDPGNGVWNRGTFSYQFGNQENLAAEEADRRQLAKIKRIYESVLLSKAEQHGVAPLTLAEELNGIDLINQAPLAVTEEGGYIERLAEAKTKKGLTGDAAILEARIWAFWDASRDGWDAPGLRAYDDLGKEASIRHDQKRRMGMIDAALAALQQTHGAIAARPPQASSAGSDRSPMTARSPRSPSQQETNQQAEQIIFGHVSPSVMPVAMAAP